MSERFVAVLTRDKTRVIMRDGAWKQTVPVSEARAQLEFYRKLWGRKAEKPGQPGPYARFYQAAVDALTAIVAKIEGGGP